MAVDQLPGEVREFAGYLNGLLARLDQGEGWSGVFWQRDPEGMRACLQGREVPPWDVVAALLDDLAAAYGAPAADTERERARALYRAALAAYDARPGAREALADRLDVMLREQRYAADRQTELARLLSTAASGPETDALRLDLAWAHDDHARASARCEELQRRLRELDRRATGSRAGAVRGQWAADPGHLSAADSGRAEMPVRGDGGGGRVALGGGRGGVSGSSGEGVGRPVAVDSGRAEMPVPARPEPDQAFGASGSLPARAFGPAGSGPGQALPAPDFRPAPAAGPAAPAAHSAPARPTRTSRIHATATPSSRTAPTPNPAPATAPTPNAASVAAPIPNPAPATAPTPTPASLTPRTPNAVPAAASAPPPPPAPAAPTTSRKRRRGSARFAGMAEDAAAPVAVPQVPVPSAALPQAAAPGRPRGARFAGGVEQAGEAQAEAVGFEEVDGEAGAAVVGAVERLARLRAEGRSGEAHVLLAEVAQWPAGRFPLLADALRAAGLGADWATLLWEAASLPPERLVGVADALAGAGRDADGRQLLRQGVARPAEQVGAAVLRLADEGRGREARALLDACARARTAEEAARAVLPDPGRLVPLLLEAARAVSEERYWDLVHALRVAGHSA
ncbi:hypothetical protein [Streptomyces camelliae]|uniref:UL36 very large tegument protein n=1 Tax=Streptomyces camelliae TaxID=3004093 RepID=A0ABY7NYI9_9ACTN|nr:hypothetical protein [Streptomyces sp. HUAS 2-6]WBO62834.1 hypothetical protein O1G22_08385 [Streptomyces sp. HUAS 2-6]